MGSQAAPKPDIENIPHGVAGLFIRPPATVLLGGI